MTVQLFSCDSVEQKGPGKLRMTATILVENFCPRTLTGGAQHYGLGGIALDQRVVLERAQRLERAGHNLLSFVEAGQDFDVGGAGDAGSDGNKLGTQLSVLVFIKHIDALDGIALDGWARGCGLDAA